MGEREQNGKEGLRMQPYCVSWRDLDSEALVLRSVLRPCFRLWLQHLPPATPVQPSNTPHHNTHTHTPPPKRVIISYGNIPVWGNVCERPILIARANCLIVTSLSDIMTASICVAMVRSRWHWQGRADTVSADVIVPPGVAIWITVFAVRSLPPCSFFFNHLQHRGSLLSRFRGDFLQITVYVCACASVCEWQHIFIVHIAKCSCVYYVSSWDIHACTNIMSWRRVCSRMSQRYLYI